MSMNDGTNTNPLQESLSDLRNKHLSLLPSRMRDLYEKTKAVPFQPGDWAVLVGNAGHILCVQNQEGDQVWYSIGQTESLIGPVDRLDLVMLGMPE